MLLPIIFIASSCSSGGDGSSGGSGSSAAELAEGLPGTWRVISDCDVYVGGDNCCDSDVGYESCEEDGCEEEIEETVGEDYYYSIIVYTDFTLEYCYTGYGCNSDNETWALIPGGVEICEVDPECSQYDEGDCDDYGYECNWDGDECTWEDEGDECETLIATLSDNNETLTTVEVDSEDGCTQTNTMVFERIE